MNDKIKEAYTKALESGLVLTERMAFTLGYLAHQKESAEQKPVAWRYRDHNGHWCFSATKFGNNEPLYSAPVNQSARIAELEADVTRLDAGWNEANKVALEKGLYLETTTQQLAAAQAENAKLREALMKTAAQLRPTCDELYYELKPLIMLPPNTTALESLLEAERIKTAEACAKVCEDVVGNTAHDQRMLSAIECAAMIRNGDWKGFVK